MDKLNKYLEDKTFIEWVYRPTPKLDETWSDYEKENPGEKENIRAAKDVLLKFKTKDRNLKDEEKIIMFSRILEQIGEKREIKKKRYIFLSVLKYVAIAFIFFSVGALFFYKKSYVDPQFFSQNIKQEYSDVAQLIRPDGENIILNETKSVIKYQNDGNILVNNDTIKPGNSTKNKDVGLNHVNMPFGRTSELILPDSTIVYLNAGSKFIYPERFTEANREVFLVGEAFFKVKHDSEHPFVVRTTDISVEVLGTQFNISAYPSDNTIETVLTEGKVQLMQNYSGFFDEVNILKPDQLASFNKTTRETKVKIVDTSDYTLWKDGMFKFESADLSRVIKKLERYYNIRFRYNDPLLGTLKISGKLELTENKDEILDRIASVSSLSIIKKGENYYEISQ